MRLSDRMRGVIKEAALQSFGSAEVIVTSHPIRTTLYRPSWGGIKEQTPHYPGGWGNQTILLKSCLSHRSRVVLRNLDFYALNKWLAGLKC